MKTYIASTFKITIDYLDHTVKEAKWIRQWERHHKALDFAGAYVQLNIHCISLNVHYVQELLTEIIFTDRDWWHVNWEDLVITESGASIPPSRRQELQCMHVDAVCETLSKRCVAATTPIRFYLFHIDLDEFIHFSKTVDLLSMSGGFVVANLEAVTLSKYGVINDTVTYDDVLFRSPVCAYGNGKSMCVITAKDSFQTHGVHRFKTKGAVQHVVLPNTYILHFECLSIEDMVAKYNNSVPDEINDMAYQIECKKMLSGGGDNQLSIVKLFQKYRTAEGHMIYGFPGELQKICWK